MMGFKYDYKCDRCGHVHELNWRPEIKYSKTYKQMCGRMLRPTLSGGEMCNGTIRRVYSTFSFRMKGEMGK